MTDKQDFLEKLRAALIERDISETDIAPYLERFDRFYDRMVNDSENATPELLSDIDRIADNIAEQVSERYDEINRLAERTLTVDRVKGQDEKTSQSVSTPEASKAPDEPDDAGKAYSAGSSQPDSRAVEKAAQVPEDDPPLSEEYDDEAHENRPPEYIDEEPSPSGTIFWVLCAVSLPITLPLALAGVAVFAGVWVGLLGLIIGSIALLVCGAAVGTALALVGIIYGISQLFSVVPVGLYELGLGIMIGSVVMFAGILLYNFAIRLVPLIMRLWGRLFRYVCGRIRVLFGFLRKECAKL